MEQDQKCCAHRAFHPRALCPSAHGRLMDLKLDTPVQFLKGVGPRRAEAFARLGVHTVEDLLYHIPHRYLDATTITPIARASVGNDVTIVGNVVSTGVIPTRRLKIFRAVIQDKTGS